MRYLQPFQGRESISFRNYGWSDSLPTSHHRIYSRRKKKERQVWSPAGFGVGKEHGKKGRFRKRKKCKKYTRKQRRRIRERRTTIPSIPSPSFFSSFSRFVSPSDRSCLIVLKGVAQIRRGGENGVNSTMLVGYSLSHGSRWQEENGKRAFPDRADRVLSWVSSL